jgi:hypothetical protein
MIRLKRKRAAAHLHPDFTGKALVDRVVELIEARLAHGDRIEFKGRLGDWKKVKKALSRDSNEKCAYCETPTAAVAHGDVEHFRPKSVYWWLALCLDNYVYSCQICNQTFKGDEFPVAGPLLTVTLDKKSARSKAAKRKLAQRLCLDPAVVNEELLLHEWLAEEPHLPHPYLEDPEPLFAWSAVETAEEVRLIEPEGASQRSKLAVAAALDYLGLNRDTLVRLRYAVYDQLRDFLYCWRQGDPSLRRMAERQIRSMCADRRPFAGMCRYFARRAGFPL